MPRSTITHAISSSDVINSFLSFFLCLLLISCSLEENPKDQVSEEEAYSSSADLFNNTVGALYHYVGGDNDGEGLQGTGRGVYDLQTFGSDEALIPTRGGDWYDGGIWQDLYYHSWGDDHEVIKNSWNYLYKVIALCNRSLEKIDENKSLLSQSQYLQNVSEIRAMRAIYYWYLLDLFGSVPIVTTTDVSIDYVEQVRRSELFDFVRTELESVLYDLTIDKSAEKSNYYGRVTRAVACFVLAKTYLNAEIYADDDWTDFQRPNGRDMRFRIADRDMNAWEACEYYCDMVTDMGYRLSTQYDSNFKVFNENSVENIWTIPMDKYFFSNQQQNMFRSYHYLHASAYGIGGENGPCASLAVLTANHFGQKGQDKRFDYNYWYGIISDANDEVILDRSGNALCYYPLEVSIDLSNSPYMETAGARMKKYEIDKFATKDGKLMDNDIVLFRYADILLMQSEARVRNGQDGQAPFDLVRDRALMERIPATLDNILNERMIEFAWEGWRRNDMIRYDIYRSTYQGPDAVDETDRHTIVFPIPADALSLNVNLHQNPGY